MKICFSKRGISIIQDPSPDPSACVLDLSPATAPHTYFGETPRRAWSPWLRGAKPPGSTKEGETKPAMGVGTKIKMTDALVSGLLLGKIWAHNISRDNCRGILIIDKHHYGGILQNE